MVKTIYNVVKKNPIVKLYLKNAYQVFNVVLSKQHPDMRNLQSVAENFFFGFHDKCPWDINNNRVLAHAAPASESARVNGNPIEIGYFTDDTLTQFIPLYRTKAWNWQQGAMLQWDPLSDSVYFNDLERFGVPQLIKLTSDGSEREIVGPATAAISLCGQFSAAISFYRFGKGLPGYGYCGINENEGNIGLPSASGELRIFDISNRNKPVLLCVSLRQCVDKIRCKSMDGAYHYISHPQFSPDSKRCAFFHRWLNKGRRVETKLCFVKLETSELVVANTGNMFSHFCWVDNEHVFGFYEDVSGNDSYGIIDTNGVNVKKVEAPLLRVDGHPNAHWKTGKIITDTYPDKSRLQNLIVVENEVGGTKCHIAGSFYAPFRFQEMFRADLHPRWNRTGDKVAIDCSFKGKRSLAIVKVSCITK